MEPHHPIPHDLVHHNNNNNDNNPRQTRYVQFWCDGTGLFSPDYVLDRRRYERHCQRRHRFRTQWHHIPAEATIAEDYESYIFPELPSSPVTVPFTPGES